MNKPIKLKREELANIIESIAVGIRAGDSFEGNITYSCIDDIFTGAQDVDPEDLGPDEFYVGGMYRAGNTMGQGSVIYLWAPPESVQEEIQENS